VFKNYIKTTLRNIFRHKGYSFLNIGGLALGIISFLFIIIYISDEMSYDIHHSKADRLYRVCRLYIANGQEEDAATLSFPAGPALQNSYPDKIEKMCRFFNFQVPKMMFEYEENDKKFYETKVFLADSTVLDMFDFEFVRGNKETALNRPFVMIITESIAKKYFGDEDPMGKSFRVEEQGQFEVSAVIKDLPKQTHLEFDFLGSMSSVRQIFGGRFPQTWIWNPCWTYVLLKENVDQRQLDELLPEFHATHYFDFPDQDITLYTQKLTDIHLKSHLLYEIRQNSNIAYIYLLAGIAIFILVIASINFMNLATASSAGRAKEIGIKKVLGADRKMLIVQFLGESIFTTFIALLFSILIMILLMTPFNNFTQKSFSPAIFLNSGMLLVMLALTLGIGILAGLYPAFFLSAFQPIKVLKGTLSSGSKGGTARKVLVIAQFTISVVLIIGTLIIFNQLSYMKKADLGFTKDNIIALPCWNTQIIPQNEAFINELLQHPSITHACGMEDLVGVDHNTHQFFLEGKDPDKPLYYPAYMVRYDFVETFDIEIITGRAFSREFPSDTINAIMINEAMAEHMGWTNEEALGKRIRKDGDERVIGVFKNFHAHSLHTKSSTFLLDMLRPRTGAFGFLRYVAIRLNTDDYQSVLPFIEEKWKEFAPTRPFEYKFLDEELDKLYNNEQKLGQLSIVLTLLGVIIACLGLFGLTSFLAVQRTKEVGIRKVLGASVGNIFYLISKEFIILVLVSNIIAFPIAYFMMKNWLQDFAYRTSIGFGAFIISALLSVIVALATVSYQSTKSALTDPADALKYE